MAEMGERLRRARVERHLTLEEAEAATKIRARYLRALEEEDYEELPEPVFARGFLRTYARYLGLDPSELLTDFRGPEPAPAIETVPPPSPRREVRLAGGGGHRRFWLGMVVLVILALVVYELLGHQGGHSPLRTPVIRRLLHKLHTSPPQPSAASLGPRLSYAGTSGSTVNWSVYGAKGLQVAGIFKGDCWVQVTADGQADNGTTYLAGQQVGWRANRQLSLWLGAPAEVDLAVNGQAFGAGGADSTPRTLIFTEYPSAK